MAAATALEPLKKLRATSGWRALDLRQIWLFRDLLTTLAERDVKLRYRQTALGVVWVILQPLLAAGIFSFVFGKVAGLGSDGIPYFIFAYAGLLGWTAFGTTVTKTSACLVGNAQLVSKVYFPRLILPLSTVFSTLIDFGVALGMMVVLMIIYGIAPSFGLLLLPVCLLLILMLALGIGLYASALMVAYRDVQYILPVMIQFLMYASPVAYSVSQVPERFRELFFLNPLSGLLEAFRWCVFGSGNFEPRHLIYAAGFAIVAFIGGALSFRKMERHFADII
jgi:lipopolysaccharide transport system permease protein